MRWLITPFGFSFIGLVFLAMLFVPNLLFASAAPEAFSALSAQEPRILVVLERTGQVLSCVFLLCTRSLRIGAPNGRQALLIAAFALMILYEIWWIRYFRGSHTPEDFYSPFLGIPVPGALLPVAALLLLGIYAESLWLLASGAVLGIGHITIHILHMLSVRSGIF